MGIYFSQGTFTVLVLYPRDITLRLKKHLALLSATLLCCRCSANAVSWSPSLCCLHCDFDFNSTCDCPNKVQKTFEIPAGPVKRDLI